MILFLLFVFADDSTGFRVIRTLDKVPEDAVAYLQEPYSIDVDASGRTYVADARANRIFVWNEDGSFRGLIGAVGDGPGEFRFNAAGEPQVFLGIVDNQLRVFDGGKRSIHSFTLEGDYLETVPLTLAGGRSLDFYFVPDGHYLLSHHHYLKEPETYELWLLNEEGQRLRVLDSRIAGSSDDITVNGQLTGVRITGYEPEFASAYHSGIGELAIGFGDTPEIQIVDLEGAVMNRLRVPMVRQEVTREDREEFKLQPWLQSEFYRVGFSDKKPFFTGLKHVGTQGYLVYLESPHYHRIEGLLVDREGNAVRKVRLTCGENGTLFGYRGRITALRTDDEGTFRLQELGF